MEPTEADCDNIQGRFTTWSLTSGARIQTGDDGTMYAATVKGSAIVGNPFEGEVETCTITIDNPTSQNAVFRFYYSNDGGTKWIILNTISGTSNPTVAKGAETTLNFSIPAASGASYKLTQISGNASVPCKVKEIAFGLQPGSSAIETVLSDIESDGEAVWYTLEGIRVEEPVGRHGIFIVKRGTQTCKVIK